jgi:hypothetical protein
MTETDFTNYDITHFTPAEIVGTGAALADISAPTIVLLERFRRGIGRTVCLLPGGLTTGKHRSEWHAAGLAVDIAFCEPDGTVQIGQCVDRALDVGYKGIGIYYNDFAYSMHLDLRPKHALWTAWKMHGEADWHYEPMVRDPAAICVGRRVPAPETIGGQ